MAAAALIGAAATGDPAAAMAAMAGIGALAVNPDGSLSLNPAAGTPLAGLGTLSTTLTTDGKGNTTLQLTLTTPGGGKLTMSLVTSARGNNSPAGSSRGNRSGSTGKGVPIQTKVGGEGLNRTK